MLWPAALTLAINGEADAHEGYRRSAETETQSEARSLYLQLADDEASHRRLLEAEYAARLGQPFSDVELDTWVRE
jgi:rubrerythrin